jgi:HPt (histidine-containing phosphotransfer) domain-containing protein
MMIDWGRVNELRAELGGEDFSEVVALFLEEGDELAGKLRAGISAAAVEEDLHFLKGSALNLGLGRLARLCQDGERLAAKGEGEAVDLHEVAEVWDRSKAEFLAGLTRLAAA